MEPLDAAHLTPPDQRGFGHQCEHGSLSRSCELCWAYHEIALLQREVESLREDQGAAKLTTWRDLITAEMARSGDTWSDVQGCSLSDVELAPEFDPDSGRLEGGPFTVWTHDWVYFPTAINGREGVASVARHPEDVPTPHVGRK